MIANPASAALANFSWIFAGSSPGSCAPMDQQSDSQSIIDLLPSVLMKYQSAVTQRAVCHGGTEEMLPGEQ